MTLPGHQIKGVTVGPVFCACGHPKTLHDKLDQCWLCQCWRFERRKDAPKERAA
jgi:hypothetical protein